MQKFSDFFSNLKEKIKNNKKLVIIIITVLLIILLVLLSIFLIIRNKNNKELSTEQVNAYLAALEETSASFEDIEQIKKGLAVYDLSNEYGRTLNEEEKNHIINVMGYDINKQSEAQILKTFKVYIPSELVDSGIIISEEFLEIYGDETYYISIIQEGNENKNILIVLKEPRTIGTEKVYSKPEEEIEYEQIVQDGEEQKQEEKIPTIIVTKAHNAKAKIQLSYSQDIVEQMNYSLMLEEDSHQYEEGFFINQNQLITTTYKQKQEEQEKDGNNRIISTLKLLSPTYKIEQIQKIDESIAENTLETNENQANVSQDTAESSEGNAISQETIPTLVFSKVVGEGYEGEIKYQYRLEVVDENGYVLEEEEGENDRYELTQNKTYNFFVNAKPSDENVNIQESDTVLIKINGSEIVQEQKSNDTTLSENLKVEVINSSRKSNRYFVFGIR